MGGVRTPATQGTRAEEQVTTGLMGTFNGETFLAELLQDGSQEGVIAFPGLQDQARQLGVSSASLGTSAVMAVALLDQ